MKNKKNIVLLLGIITFIAGCVMLIISFTQFGKKKAEIYDKAEVLNIKQTSQEIPDFSVKVTGAYTGDINKELLSAYNIKVYEFDAIIDNGWDHVKNHYVGFRLLDMLNAFNITDFSSIKFTSGYRIDMTQLHSRLTNDIFITFFKDGKSIDENFKIGLLNVDKGTRFSLDGIQGMHFEYVPNLDDIDNNNKDNENDQSDKTDQQQ